MALNWVRLDCAFFDHPKILELIEAKKHRVVVAHLAALAYTGKHGLDGHIPRAALRRIDATTGDVETLVDLGLWDAVETGWDVHDWTDYQFTSDENRTRRERAIEAGKKGACIRHHGASCGCWASPTL